MKPKSILRSWSVAACLLFITPLAVFAQGTAFTYQGRLNDNASDANGAYDFRFRLAADALGNSLVAGPLLTNAVLVAGGLFAVTLNLARASLPDRITGCRWM